jgi:tripartite-type tricarboxylate transporter receptor subunit TctC
VLEPIIKQPVVIETKAGAAGAVGAQFAAAAKPDGYTLLMQYSGYHVITPHVSQQKPQWSAEDLRPVANVLSAPQVIVVREGVPAKNLAELIAYAKANPGKLTYASSGNGSLQHVTGAMLEQQAGIEMTHVPYKGSAPALTDLVGGHVSMYFSSLPPAIALVKEGKIRALAVTGPARSPIFPELPTIAEAALPGFEAVLHYGIVAPAGTPKPIITKLNAALRQAVMSDDFKQKLAADGTEPLVSTPEEYAADIDKEETKWSAIVKKSGAKAE